MMIVVAAATIAVAVVMTAVAVAASKDGVSLLVVSLLVC
jgi:hypothetical protein